MFYVVEGIDGAGKSTLLKSLACALQAQNQDLLCLQEPSKEPTGQKIRSLLQAQRQLSAQEWVALFLEDRKINIAKHIQPALKAKKVILQDRYFYSTAAYQGVAHKEETKDRIQENAAYFAQGIIDMHLKQVCPLPDQVFFLQIHPELALERIKRRRAKQESFENLKRLHAVAACYESILPSGSMILDASLDIDTLCKSCLSYLKKHK